MTPGSPREPRQVGEALRPRKTAELLADRLRSLIVSGELQPGTPLPSEGELMQQFKVARPTVREAMRLLEADGLIAVRRGAPARVTAPDTALAARLAGLVLQMEGTTLDDVFRTRLLLEPACARLVASSTDPGVVATLEMALALDLEGDDADLSTPTGLHFHDAVIDLCGSNTLRILCQILRHIMYAHSAMATEVDRRDPARRAKNLAAARVAHERLIRAVEARDPDEAERVWRSHLSRLSVVLVDQLETLDLGDVLGTLPAERAAFAQAGRRTTVAAPPVAT